MRIGILTYYGAPNYGAMLQALALQAFLKSRGHEVFFLATPLTCPAMRFCDKLRLWYTLLRTGDLKRFRHGLEYHRSFSIVAGMRKFFREYPVRYSSGAELRQLPPKLDAVVVGSDQIWWNLSDENRRDIFLARFAEPQMQKIAYAASMGGRKVESGVRSLVAIDLASFSAIGMREPSGVEEVESLGFCGRLSLTPDPTLLVDMNVYKPVASSAHQVAVGHVFDYFLDWDTPDARRYSTFIASKVNAKGVFNATRKSGSVICRAFGIEDKIPVADWLRGIEESEFVVTNSFHGTVFAILNHRPFVCVKLSGSATRMNERIDSLLCRLGLLERFVGNYDESNLLALVNSPIDWKGVDSKIRVLRNGAESFFKEIGM